MYRKIPSRIIYIFIMAIIMISFLFVKSPIYWVIIDFGLMLFIIIKAKISFLSVNAIVSTYPLIAIVCEYYFNFSYGLLHISKLPLHISEIALCIFIFDAILGGYVNFTDALKREREMLQYVPRNCDKLTCLVFAVMSSVLVVIAFPYGFFSFESRQQAALRGQAWMLLALYALFFSINYAKDSLIIAVFDAFTIAWYILHAERVEFIGFLIMLVVVSIYRGKKHVDIRQYIKFIVLFVIFVVTMAYVGNLVRGSSTQFAAILKSVLVQGSMVDMMYVFNTGIDYVKEHGLLLGKTLMVYLDKLFLFGNLDNFYGNFLNSYARNAGGGYALTEGYLNFGYLGVIAQSLIQILWINFCIKKKNNYRYFCYCFLFSLCFRYTWYGYHYYEKTPVMYVPAFLLMLNLIHSFCRQFRRETVVFQNRERK